MTTLSDIVNFQLSVSTTTGARPAFGVPAVMGYHTHNGDRMRTYSGTAGMIADGFLPDEPTYLKAAAIFAQNPHPPIVKVGRRASAWSQVVRVTPVAAPDIGGGDLDYAAGTVFQITIGGDVCSYTSVAEDGAAEVCTGLAAAINAAPDLTVDVDDIIMAGVSTAGIQTLTVFDGDVGSHSRAPARALELVLSNNADWDTTVAVVTGKDSGGNAISENFAIPNNGGTTVTGSKLFAQVTQAVIPAQSGGGGTYTLGTRARVAAAVGGAGDSSYVTVTTTLGAPEFVAYYNASETSNLVVLDVTTDPGLAADLAAIIAADPSWYEMVFDAAGPAEILAGAVFTEANKTIRYRAQTMDTKCSDTVTASDSTSIAYTLQHANYFRTELEFAKGMGGNYNNAAAHVGVDNVIDPGNATEQFKVLAGVPADIYTSSQSVNLRAKNVSTYEAIGFPNSSTTQAITMGAKVAAGEWGDVIRLIDAFRATAQIDLFNLFIGSPKIPGTDIGGAQIAATLEGSLAKFSPPKNNGFAGGDTNVVIVPPASTGYSGATRIWSGITVGAQIAGAVHAVSITGTLVE